MALTVEQIHSVANEIADQGDRPTLSRVRKALGGGSFSTISEAMQSWHQRQSEEHALSAVQVPESLAERFQQLQAAAWQVAIEQAERRLAAEREALHEAQEAAATEVAEAREAVATLEEEAEVREQELETLRNQLADAEAVAKDALAARKQAEQQRDADAARLGEKIEGLEARLADAVDARKQAEARETAAVQDAKATGKTLEEVRHKLGEAERTAATAEARAQERADSLRAEQEARQAAETSLSEERRHHESELEQWRQELDAAHFSAVESQQLNERVSGLESRLADAHRTIERLTAVSESNQVRKDNGPGSEDEQAKLPL